MRSLDGTYGFVYCGATGLEIGVIVVNSGDVVGSDFSGGRYTGTLIEDDTGNLDFKVIPCRCRHYGGARVS